MTAPFKKNMLIINRKLFVEFDWISCHFFFIENIFHLRRTFPKRTINDDVWTRQEPEVNLISHSVIAHCNCSQSRTKWFFKKILLNIWIRLQFIERILILKKKSFEGPDGAAVKWIRSSPKIFIRFQEFIDGWFTQLVMEGAQIETNNFRLPVRSKRAILRQNK